MKLLRKTRIAAAIVAAICALQPLAQAEQWAYAMQTGHGNHSIQVDVDSLARKTNYVSARLLYEYFYDAAHAADPANGEAPHSALVEGAFDCKAQRYQELSRTEFLAAEAKGAAFKTTKSELNAERWKPVSADAETFAIVDWVCGVAANKLPESQTGSMP